jgi:hypothetical protein
VSGKFGAELPSRKLSGLVLRARDVYKHLHPRTTVKKACRLYQLLLMFVQRSWNSSCVGCRLL